MKRFTGLVFSLLPVLAFAQQPVPQDQAQFPQQMSASRLLKYCASSALTQAGRERRRYCAGFTSGVEETLRILQQQHKLEASVCLPDDVRTKALTDAFIRYSADRQKHLEKPASAMVMEALTHTWPCTKSSAD
jgi:hypothetical protein